MKKPVSRPADNIPTADELRRKAARKALPGGRVRWINLPRNWAHQALSYMDAGELSFRVVVQVMETALVWLALELLLPWTAPGMTVLLALVLVHTWNWITNGLFWSVLLFSFPNLKNPGAQKTVDYLNDMSSRLSASRCISGIAVYGSVSRSKWHDRSDIEIRLLRRAGLGNLVCAGIRTMHERWLALRSRQPMDLYLADDVDFLNKMRVDEIPMLLLARDARLAAMYPQSQEMVLSIKDLTGEDAATDRDGSC